MISIPYSICVEVFFELYISAFKRKHSPCEVKSILFNAKWLNTGSFDCSLLSKTNSVSYVVHENEALFFLPSSIFSINCCFASQLRSKWFICTVGTCEPCYLLWLRDAPRRKDVVLEYTIKGVERSTLIAQWR
jgi:hypothetical protein